MGSKKGRRRESWLLSGMGGQKTSTHAKNAEAYYNITVFNQQGVTMYPKAKYINIFESKFVRPNKTGRAGVTYASNSDKMVTLRLDSIVSIHTETIEYSHHRYCTVTMSNGFRYKVTEETAEAICLCLNIDSIYEERGEE